MSKPNIPQGTRDFSPQTVRNRRYILNTLQRVFENQGFQPIETPSMENLSTLMGKYGEEGDRLIFKILNNGLSDPKKHTTSRQALENILLGKSDITLTERALRYDLTIPFARYVVMHQNNISFPFRRYQMQAVWRADRPQAGRYREFYQCDADVVGTNSIICEAELISIYRQAFCLLNIPQIVIRINNRKILLGIAQYANASDKLIEITVAIDKLDKIGVEGVEKELSNLKLESTQIKSIIQLITIESIDTMENLFKEKNIEDGLLGIQEIRQCLNYNQHLEQKSWYNSTIKIDFTLARGLNYYTGIIIEVNCKDNRIQMGSIGGGGRYDDLTSLFGLKNISGVGISFGVDRIYDVLETLNLFPEDTNKETLVMILNTDAKFLPYTLNILNKLRENNISSEIYPDAIKYDKQMKYIFKRNIPYAIIVENEEFENKTIRVKNFVNTNQSSTTIDAFIDELIGIN